jgi:hypothetical protein
MKLLSTMAAIRLDEDGDNIDTTLSLALVDAARPGTTDRSIQSLDPLASSSWERVCVGNVPYLFIYVCVLKQCTVLFYVD